MNHFSSKTVLAVALCNLVGFTSHSFAFPNAPVTDTPVQSELLISVKDDGAKAFVQKMTDTGLSFLSDTSLSKEQKEKAFKKLLIGHFDINAIGKFAVGRYWREMSSAQQKEYQTLFKNMLVGVYSKRFDEYQGQTVEIKEAVNLSEKDTLVKSIIMEPNGGSDIPVDWRVRHKNGSYKIIDVMVAGVSMSVTQRSDFASVIQRGGGKADALISHLKN